MQSSRKQPSQRLEKRENSRRWLLIPALCAAVILAVVLIVELNKQPQVLPDSSNTTPVSHDQPTTPDPEPEPDPEAYTGASDSGEPLESGAGGLDGGLSDPAQRTGDRQALL